jgi:hypothetical protein
MQRSRSGQQIRPAAIVELLARSIVVLAARTRMASMKPPSSRPTPIADSYWLIEGKLLAGEYPGHRDDDRAREKLRRVLEAGIRSFVDLTEVDDPLEPYEGLLKEVADDLDVEVRYTRLPIRDMHIPTAERMTEILERVTAEVEAGRAVYFHCWGGIGRTGTVAGCWLVEQGLHCDEALAKISELRKATPDAWKASPQTDAQRTFVREWRRRSREDEE